MPTFYHGYGCCWPSSKRKWIRGTEYFKTKKILNVKHLDNLDNCCVWVKLIYKPSIPEHQQQQEQPIRRCFHRHESNLNLSNLNVNDKYDNFGIIFFRIFVMLFCSLNNTYEFFKCWCTASGVGIRQINTLGGIWFTTGKWYISWPVGGCIQTTTFQLSRE